RAHRPVAARRGGRARPSRGPAPPRLREPRGRHVVRCDRHSSLPRPPVPHRRAHAHGPRRGPRAAAAVRARRGARGCGRRRPHRRARARARLDGELRGRPRRRRGRADRRAGAAHRAAALARGARPRRRRAAAGRGAGHGIRAPRRDAAAARRRRPAARDPRPRPRGHPHETEHPMTLRTDLYIDGQWRAGDGGERFDVIDPSDLSVIERFAIATEADCMAAVDAAAAAQDSWAATAPRVRGELLRAAYEVLVEEAELFAEIMVRENGKSWSDAMGEAGYATEFFRWFSEEAVRISGDYRLSPGGDKRIVVDRQPIGVSLLITPWNFPAAMATRKLGPALAAGCTTILKPARETPLTAAYVVDVLHRVGVPRGVVNLVTPVPTGPLVNAM